MVVIETTTCLFIRTNTKMGDVSPTEDLEDKFLSEETLIREGNDLLKICEQIYSHTPQALEYDSNFKDIPKDYTSSLERNVNILKLYLELLLEFIGLSPKIISTFRRHKAVYTPELSVPAIAYTLWIRVKFLTTDSIRNELSTIVEESERNKTSTETQTLVLSLTACESCYLSQSVVKELVSKVELFCSTHEITESSVLNTKDQLRSKVHDMTEWNAMNKWCKALTTDIEQLTEISDKLLSNWKRERLKEKQRYEELENRLREAEKNRVVSGENDGNTTDAKYKALEIENKNLTTELDQKRQEIKELTFKAKYFEEEYQAEQSKNQKLQNELEENTKELQELRNNVEDYKASSISIKGKCEQLKNESKNEKQNIKKIEAQVEAKIIEANSIITEYELEISQMNKRVQDMENESRSQQKTMNEQLKSLEIQEREINKFKKSNQLLNERLKENEKMVESFNNLQEDCKNIRKELDSKRKEEVIMKEKMILLERQINNLSAHCDYLKQRLKICDPSYQRGTGETLKGLETDIEGSIHSNDFSENEDDLNRESK
ncbi:unnamed protein product [Nezara viridula]|uniref:Uncharacterized protein n=1 Tax=Nezara viridula TaxID=85310 RepID=A0A9P0MPS7_NEZVI|nr:unnamed protein product [Nezara viridula]